MPIRAVRARVRLALISACCVLAALASPVDAQTGGIISGTVVSERSGGPVSDAQVATDDRAQVVTTDASGRFRLGGLPGSGNVRITVRRLGYQPRTETVAVGSSNIRIALVEQAVQLTEVVTTGTAGVAEKRAIGNAVTTVKASEVVATQPIASFQELLNGRASGVSVVSSTGQVGGGSRIRVRGASSLSLGNDPLIYVDGVRVDNTQASGPGNQAFGSQSI
jgi:hypothetical protein